ncbi:MAG TPA: radical SAM protein [Desulforhopalus sp.]|nr:radical SAM protein [Desulforhopalus sp.]
MRFFSILGDVCRGKTPGQLVIQLTDLCNAACPQCGMRRSADFRRNSLSLDQCREIIDRAAERGVSALSLTGGEPLLYLEEVTKLVNHAARAGINYTRTGTNGFLLARPEAADFIDRVKRCAESLAASKLRNFWISIDSAVPQTHEKMRGLNGLISGIEKALPVFHGFGLYPTANLGLNRNLGGESKALPILGNMPTQEQAENFTAMVAEGLSSFFRLVGNLGFSIVNFCYPMSVTAGDGLAAVYPASADEQLVRFSRAEKAGLFTAMLEVIPRFRRQLRIFSPLSAVDTLARIYRNEPVIPFPCRGGTDYFFISATDGHTYPCGFRGEENLGDYRFTNPGGVRGRICTACDWECFRDPSELLGPVSCALSAPWALFTRHRRTPAFYRLWLEDLRYYQACDYFDGRRPSRLHKLPNGWGKSPHVAQPATG